MCRYPAGGYPAALPAGELLFRAEDVLARRLEQAKGSAVSLQLISKAMAGAPLLLAAHV